MITRPPCKDCSERHRGCHYDCERYLEFKAYREAEREEMRKGDEAIRFKIDGCRKARSIAHRHKPK